MLLAIIMCLHDKNQLVVLDRVTELVLNFSRPLLVSTTRKGPRPYFSNLHAKLMLRLYVLTLILAYLHATLRLKPGYAI